MIFKIFLHGDKFPSLLVLLSLGVAAAVEAVGIGALLPAAAVVIGQDGGSSGGSAAIKRIIEGAGIMSSFKNFVRLIAAATVLKAVVSLIAMSDTAVVAAGELDVKLAIACRLEQASFLHAGAEIIHAKDLEIPNGQITVLQAPSGPGKTAIIDPLIGFYQPSRGSIEIYGVVAITHRPAWADGTDRLYVVEQGRVRVVDAELQGIG